MNTHTGKADNDSKLFALPLEPRSKSIQTVVARKQQSSGHGARLWRCVPRTGGVRLLPYSAGF